MVAERKETSLRGPTCGCAASGTSPDWVLGVGPVGELVRERREGSPARLLTSDRTRSVQLSRAFLPFGAFQAFPRLAWHRCIPALCIEWHANCRAACLVLTHACLVLPHACLVLPMPLPLPSHWQGLLNEDRIGAGRRQSRVKPSPAWPRRGSRTMASP